MSVVGSDIAVISSQGLGDGLLQLVFAQNLARQGYRVTFFQDHLNYLSSEVKFVDVQPYSNAKLMQAKLHAYKVVLFDHGSYFSKKILPEFDQIPNHFIPYVVSRGKLKETSPIESFKAHIDVLGDVSYMKFIGFNDSIRHPIIHHKTISEHFQWKTEKVLGVQDYSLHPKFLIPSHWERQKFKKRILIHPTSSSKDKNWSAHLFVELAQKLENLGWIPEFTMSPNEMLKWQALLGDKWLSPSFSSTLELSQYYYESAALIGGDSGNGHLASAMQLPVLTIFNRKKLFYPWKPSWSKNIVVAPWLPKSIVKEKWSQYLSVNTVLRKFIELMES